MDASNGQKEKGHVKKPLNAYFVWSRMLRPKILKENPEITVCQANVLLGKIWSGMSVEQKEPYFQESQRMKKQHEVDYPEIQSNPKPRDKPSKNKNYETATKFIEIGDSHLRNNRFYQMSQMVSVPSGQLFLPMTHNDVPKTKVAFYTPYDIPDRMPPCPQQLYMNTESCRQAPTRYNGYIPQWSMVPAYPYEHYSVGYAHLQQGEGRIPQACLYKSAPFEVPNTQVEYFANPLAQENSAHKNPIFIQQPEPEPFSNAHLYGSQSRCDPVIMTGCLNNNTEIITLPSILSKTEGISGTLLHIPEQNGIYFERGYYGPGRNASDSRMPENLQTLPLSQSRNRIVENSQCLAEDTRLHTQRCNADILFGNKNYQHAPTSQQVHKENQPTTFSNVGILDTPSTTLSQPYEQHSNQSSDILKAYKSDISNDKDFGCVVNGTDDLGDLVSCFWVNEDFPSSNIANEEVINL